MAVVSAFPRNKLWFLANIYCSHHFYRYSEAFLNQYERGPQLFSHRSAYLVKFCLAPAAARMNALTRTAQELCV